MNAQIILALGGTLFLVCAVSLVLIARSMMTGTSLVFNSVGWHN